MLTAQQPAGFALEAKGVVLGSLSAAAVITGWVVWNLGALAFIAFPIAFFGIVPVATLIAPIAYGVAVLARRANRWSAAIGGLLAGMAPRIVDLTGLGTSPGELALFGAAGVVGGLVFWEVVREATNLSPPPEPAARSAP